MLLSQEKIKKIAVFRALQLGDMLCVIPALRALRKSYPDARITLLGLPWAGVLLKRFPGYFDGFIHFPGYPGLPEQLYDEQAYRSFLQRLGEEQFDLVLQMQGNGTVVNDMMKEWNCRYLAGFHNQESKTDNQLFPEYPAKEHEVIRHIKLMEHLGIPSCGTYMEFPELPGDVEEVNSLYLPVIDKRYICLHPGSRGDWRRWPPQDFAILADHCIEQGYIVLITGTPSEQYIVEEVMKCMKHKAIDVSGKTSLGAVAYLIRHAALLIANCTGVSHIAAATGTPSLIISMDGEPGRWGAMNKQIHTTINWLEKPSLENVFNELYELMDRINSKQMINPLSTNYEVRSTQGATG
ncbi:glycosyltransferase family 9 protein [Danxiaibacter flavus]|uniref:Glycosyltransferase family 9 protein n=1 Tax=Danxiaibacter flavus TaxID=3049108 RepID=A0ABV3ZIR5_9BACT|nr:glycosyltransferase family 9 protein [Chitinophagaceae bacterium DXS]